MLNQSKQLGVRVDDQELVGLFEPDEGSVNMYYGRIGNGKTYNATADILDLLEQGRVIYANWHINFDGFDERQQKGRLFWSLIFFWRKRFYNFKAENFHYFEPDDVDVEFLSNLTDCDLFIDEGQWLFDSYEGTKFSKEKRRLILHTRHLNRSLNIISQRTQAIQRTARGQVNRYFKCVRKLTFPFLIFQRIEYQEMAGEDVDETQEPISVKTYFAKKKVLQAYDTQYLRAGVPRSQEVYFEGYDLGYLQRLQALWLAFRYPHKDFSPYEDNENTAESGVTLDSRPKNGYLGKASLASLLPLRHTFRVLSILNRDLILFPFRLQVSHVDSGEVYFQPIIQRGLIL